MYRNIFIFKFVKVQILEVDPPSVLVWFWFFLLCLFALVFVVKLIYEHQQHHNSKSKAVSENLLHLKMHYPQPFTLFPKVLPHLPNQLCTPCTWAHNLLNYDVYYGPHHVSDFPVLLWEGVVGHYLFLTNVQLLTI